MKSTNPTLKLLLALTIILCQVFYLAAQIHNDGPIELQIRVTAVKVDYDTTSNQSNDFNLSGSIGGVVGNFINVPSLADDEITCKVWARANSDVDSMGWQGGDCIMADLPMDSGGPEIYIPPTPVIIFSHVYTGQIIPQFFDLKLEAWEDDKSSDFDQMPSNVPFVLDNACQTSDGYNRCAYNTSGSCFTLFGAGVFSESDDIHCESDSFKTGLDYRAAGPPGQWNSHGFIAGNCPSNNFYQIEIESYWRYTDSATTISGRIISETGIPIGGVTVMLSGDDSLLMATDTAGGYNFSVTQGGTYTITPAKSNDVTVANGITSLDLLLMRRHILGIGALGSPYKIIAAAEANADGDTNVSTLDILRTRELILGNATSFPSSFPTNRLWQFVSSDYIFPDASNPFPFDKTRTYTNITTNQTNQDFIGIKLGDVNGSWDAGTP